MTTLRQQRLNALYRDVLRPRPRVPGWVTRAWAKVEDWKLWWAMVTDDQPQFEDAASTPNTEGAKHGKD